MNSAQIAIIRLLARQAVRDYLHAKPAQLSQNCHSRTNHPVPSLADKK